MSTTVTLPEIVDAETVAEMIARHARIKLIDVRTPAEFESAHIPGSYNVPLDLLSEHRDELRDSLQEPAILVCRSGGRARQAADMLRAAHLSHLHILEGGMSAWEAARRPIKRGRQRWSLERQVRGMAGVLVVAGALGGLFVAPPIGALAAIVGAGLAFSAATDTCGMAALLARLPYNRGATCDIREVVARIAVGEGQRA
jgi:rhodanese-related sulfurtransferase